MTSGSPYLNRGEKETKYSPEMLLKSQMQTDSNILKAYEEVTVGTKEGGH